MHRRTCFCLIFKKSFYKFLLWKAWNFVSASRIWQVILRKDTYAPLYSDIYWYIYNPFDFSTGCQHYFLWRWICWKIRWTNARFLITKILWGILRDIVIVSLIHSRRHTDHNKISQLHPHNTITNTIKTTIKRTIYRYKIHTNIIRKRERQRGICT